ncbi:hypothetical protein [Paenibacillus sp. KN14-4R]|uniref:hypothetical protein n=1 Tax=Paenibacillus sp. KN14-4R TaxID=3445773 RepID=UPI003F9FAC3B
MMNQEEYDESEHYKESYAYFGLAVYHAQVLEQQLVNMIVLIKKSQGLIPTLDDYEALYERKLSNTMGQLINEIKQLFQLQDFEINELKEVLKLRNFIVHDYFKERIILTFSIAGRSEIINELNEFVERVRSLDARLVNYSRELHKRLGITEEMLEEEVDKLRESI